jgi:tRNA nucleotidyltransferase (CCA-adding enzyme)
MDAKSLDRVVVRLAVLCHDLGKATTTTADLRAPGHCEAGVAPTRSFLGRVGAPAEVVEKVVKLVENHMVLAGQPALSDKAVRRLAKRLAPATVEQLVAVMRADHSATGGVTKSADEVVQALVDAAARLHVADQAPKPLVLGRHLLEMGVQPGPAMGSLLAHLFDQQLEGVFTTLEGGLAEARRLLDR